MTAIQVIESKESVGTLGTLAVVSGFTSLDFPFFAAIKKGRKKKKKDFGRKERRGKYSN